MLRAVTPDTTSRDRLIAAILRFLPAQDPLASTDIRVALEREIEEAGPDGVLALKERLVSDTGWGRRRR